MKQTLSLKLGQQLTMTPQLQQAIRLLQLSSLDLQQEIQEALESNPMLELEEESGDQADDAGEDGPAGEDGDRDADYDYESDDSGDADYDDTDYDAAEDGRDEYNGDADAADYQAASADDAPEGPGDGADGEDWDTPIPDDLPVDTQWDDIYQGASTSAGPAPEDDWDLDARNSAAESLQDHLTWQLNLTPMSDLDRMIAVAIIDAIGPDGMLTVPIEDIVDSLGPFEEDEEPVELDEVVAVLKRIQQFDPTGVAARDLAECLSLQLRQLPQDTPWLAEARSLVEQHLDLLGNRDFAALKRKLKVSEGELTEIIQLIQSLNPRPGSSIAPEAPEYIVPDVLVTRRSGRWHVELNAEATPRLRINDTYASLVKRADNSTDNAFLRDNLQEARWFLKSLQSRNETLLKVATKIVEHQRGFLEYGEEAMKPLVLHDIAEAVDMHESTISRVTNRKYMHTPRGIFELKYFFSSHVSTSSGGEVSSTAIRALIKKLTAEENPRKPLSDNKIAAILAEQNINVARRTVAKYRESLAIPPSNERKRLV
ncbi:MAG: RNA polymerase factor sigma-54 [Gammaproteobacteria bacterium]|nr:RNA polymerase factor sigma-54 [Gammaproteobacteria bacterium]MBK79728.1 RNA polymerase factor sigma-54 [Gammaproteobacteria bacterium]|tara:strand:- start:2504 stop:4126 length:1623 start_codon:yes stop_codon:yes gene_type:complete